MLLQLALLAVTFPPPNNNPDPQQKNNLARASNWNKETDQRAAAAGISTYRPGSMSDRFLTCLLAQQMTHVVDALGHTRLVVAYVRVIFIIITFI
jgi:hypothetical protein